MVYIFSQFILYLFANILNSEECNIQILFKLFIIIVR